MLDPESPLFHSPKWEFWAGVRAELPILIGDIPFGLIYGALANQAGLSAVASQGMSSIVFAGSSQLVATQLFGTATPAIIIILTIVVVNLRHALYSASVAPFIKHKSMPWKLLLGYLLTDEAYAVAITHYNDDAPIKNKHWYFLGAGLALWSSWQISTLFGVLAAVGILGGMLIPSSWGLDFVLALTFIALVVPGLRDRAGLAAALSAGVVAVIAYPLPYKLWIILAALVGILTGMWLERQK